MKLQFILPLIVVLLGFYTIETEALFGFGAIIRVVQRLIRLAAEAARRGSSIPYRQLTSSTQTLVKYGGQSGARGMVKNGLSRVKNVVLSPKFQAGIVVSEGVEAIIDAVVAASHVEVNYDNFTDAELQEEWEVRFLFRRIYFFTHTKARI